MYMMYIRDENGAVNGIGLWYPGDTAWTYYYFVKNLQGDVLEVYNEAHSCVATYTYDAWGNILSKSGSLADINPFRYRGYYFDNESWFYYLQSRYYDPAIGRFINADVLTSTGQGLLGNNMFAYCNNNPVMYSDPSGESLIGAMIGGAIGGAFISTVSYIVNARLSGQDISKEGVINAALTGGISGAVGGSIGTISLGGTVKTFVAKGLASVATGIAVGIKSGMETEGSGPKRRSTGISVGLITAISTFLGSQIAAYDVVYGFAGNVFTNLSATLFVGAPAEIASVAVQQTISVAEERSSGANLPLRTAPSGYIGPSAVSLVC